MKNNFNALLNSLGPDYLWNFFEKHFEQLINYASTLSKKPSLGS